MSADDHRWIEAAARLALRARPLSRPNPAVGCIILHQGAVVARGITQPSGRPHAEAVALAALGNGNARDCDVYVTLEPCAHVSARGPSCAQLLAQARPRRVIVGIADPDPRTAGKGIETLEKAGCAVTLLDSAAARASLAGYLNRKRLGRPHVTLKLAMSLDGKIALGDGSSRWITSEIARAHVHARRALADAILVGGETWRRDRPRLDCRLEGLESRSPQRLVLTRQRDIEGASAIASPRAIGDLEDIQYLYVEGGAATAGSFLEKDLVDRLEIYRAPIVIGEGLSAITGFAPESLDRAHGRWQAVEQTRLGPDEFAAYERKR